MKGKGAAMIELNKEQKQVLIKVLNTGAKGLHYNELDHQEIVVVFHLIGMQFMTFESNYFYIAPIEKGAA